jgi:hypothetical protein
MTDPTELERQDKPIECTSPDGITIGLVDSLITISIVLDRRLRTELARLNKQRPDEDGHAYHSQAVQDAMADLAGNQAVRRLLWPRDDAVMAVLHEAANLLEGTR